MKTNNLFSRLKAGHMLLGIVFLSTLISCSKDDALQPTTLNITVMSSNSNNEEGVSVDLYASENDWLAGQNMVASGVTDVVGKVSFMDLKLTNYYIDAHRGHTTNWDMTPETNILENQSNEETILVNTTLENYLVGKKEKAWGLTGAALDGFDLYPELDECEKDNVFFYQREDKLSAVFFGDVKCPSESGDQEVFVWSFDTQEEEIILSAEQGEGQVFRIVSLTNEKLEADIDIDFEGQLVAVRFTFEPVE